MIELNDKAPEFTLKKHEKKMFHYLISVTDQ